MAAAHQLKQLCNKFDFADATRAELDIVENVAAFYFAPDLLVQAAHRFESAVIQVTAKYEWPHQGGEFIGPVSAHNAGLDPRIALPLAALRDEIIFKHAKTDG